MILLTQSEHNLIGSKEDIEALEKKENARILAISDSHGKYTNLFAIISRYGPTCDALVFCGDGMYDIARLLEDANSSKEVRKLLPPVIAFASGNGDPQSIPLNFKIRTGKSNDSSLPASTLIVPFSQKLKVNGQNFFVTHGHKECIDFTFSELGLKMQYEGCRTGFYGHTHVTSVTQDKGFKFINPGSCSRPRGGQPACFAIVTVGKNFTDVAHLKFDSETPDNIDFSLWTPIY